MSLFRQRCSAPGTHRYEPRYDIRPAVVAVIEALHKAGRTNDYVKGVSVPEQNYVCDVCRWCGDVKQRPASPPGAQPEQGGV